MKQSTQKPRGRPLGSGQALVKREFSLTPEQMAAIERISRETGVSLSMVGRELIGVGLEKRPDGFEDRMRQHGASKK